MTYLREEEIERLFSVIDLVRDRAVFRLEYHAGLRASEVGMLQFRDYVARVLSGNAAQIWSWCNGSRHCRAGCWSFSRMLTSSGGFCARVLAGCRSVLIEQAPPCEKCA